VVSSQMAREAEPVEVKAPPRKRRRESLLERHAALLLAMAILLVWQLWVLVSGISPFVLPSPVAIIGRIVTEAPLLLSHLYITLLEVLGGFGLAVVIGIPTSLLIFYSRAFERAIFPLLIALQTIPKVALAPLLVLYFGYGWAPKITLAFLISFFPIVIATVVGLQSLEKGLVNLVRSMGANEWQTFFKVRLPAALPSLFGGLKVGMSLAVIGAIIGEYVAAESGLGYLQMQATSRFDTTLNFATVVTIAGMGVTLYFVLGLIERKVAHRREAAL
jgi:NitT/TauT family transport system permease protein